MSSFNPVFNKFKLKSLKTYSSKEWLADLTKKYRQVFDRHDISFIYCEVALWNKMYELEDWEINIELRCYKSRKPNKVITKLSYKKNVGKFDPIFYFREGWGQEDKGTYWKKGKYYWEILVDGEPIGKTAFYIEEARKPSTKIENPYLELESVKLFEGSFEDVNKEENTYYQQFDADETRYIYTEITLKNINIDVTWQCELITKYFNESRELKGEIVRLHKLEKLREQLIVTAGWGSDLKGSWYEGKYTAEIIFMDKLLAVIPFEVGDSFIKGIPPVLLPDRQSLVLLNPFEENPETFEEVNQNLENLIGLNNIKQKVRDHAKYLRFLQLRKEKGFEEKEAINVHSVFIGNPGTGKTTVAKMMGKLYQKMGILSKGHVHEVDRVDLVGEYIGQTAPKVKEAIENARGGVLFIDEAYALARSSDDSKDFGREVIEILMKEMSNGVGDMAVIVAGYPKEMKHFLDSNPGLKSRFKLYFEFTDYLPQELSQIADFAAHEKSVQLTIAAKNKINDLIVDAYRKRDRSFGNARFVFDLIEKAKINLGLRVMSSEEPSSLDDNAISTIEYEDVSKIQIKERKELPKIPVDEVSLQAALNELNHMIGMENIKHQINELVQLVKFYKDTKKNVLNSFFLHTVFIGNPGTGKTTVARILTKIYRSLGVLERGHMIETDRQGLVAGFVGQTAIKTTEKIDEAMGGVLFIDEAYALTSRSSGASGDFGNEAIQTLLKRMEDNRGEFFVFVAGYPKNMEDFLKANPGLKSRFDKILRFEDYSPAELFRIADQMLTEEGITASEEALAHLKKYLHYIHDYRDAYFGNARTVRNIVGEAIKNQNLRLAQIPVNQRTNDDITLLTMEDVSSFKLDKSDFVFNRNAIGFKSNSPSSN